MNTKNLINQALYEQDYALWLETAIEQLKQGRFEDVDLKNLIEELEGMTKSDKRALKSLLTRLFEHLLKLTYWESEREYNSRGWKGEIRNFRILIQEILEDSPSRRADLEEAFPKCYRNARHIVIDITGINPKTIPQESFATLNEVLDEDWFPNFPNNATNQKP